MEINEEAENGEEERVTYEKCRNLCFENSRTGKSGGKQFIAVKDTNPDIYRASFGWAEVRYAKLH